MTAPKTKSVEKAAPPKPAVARPASRQGPAAGLQTAPVAQIAGDERQSAGNLAMQSLARLTVPQAEVPEGRSDGAGNGRRSSSTTPAAAASKHRTTATRGAEVASVPAVSAGNFAIQRLRRSATIQPKLTIGQPGDVFEQEADEVADRIMRSVSPAVIQRKYAASSDGAPCEQCRNEEKLQAKEASGGAADASPAVERSLTSLRGGGEPLPTPVRTFFEPRLAADLSKVRVHTNSQAEQSTRAIGAKAFTSGQDVVFGRGQYAPETGEGQRLLAHELTHVVQQTGPGDSAVPPTNVRRQVDPNASGTTTPIATPSSEPVQAGPPSFDPLAVDVAGMRNDTLTSELMRVDDWFAAHGSGDPDYAAYDTLRGRLRGERTTRVELGHMWMRQTQRATPTRFYMMAPGAGGRLEIILVDPERALGVPGETPAGPIMTEAQYQGSLAANNVPVVDQQTYDALRAARQVRSGDNQQDQDASSQARTASGPPSGPVTPVLAMYFPPAAVAQQPGGLMLHHGTSQSGYQGFAGGIDLTRLSGEHQDFSRGLYTYTSAEAGQFGADVRAGERGEAGMRYVLQWE